MLTSFVYNTDIVYVMSNIATLYFNIMYVMSNFHTLNFNIVYVLLKSTH